MLRSGKVRQYLQFMEARGHAKQAILEHTHIDLARLNDPAYFVSAEQCHDMISNMVRVTGQPELGLKVGLGTSIASLGIVGYAMASSTNLGEAIALWVKYGNSPLDGPLALKLEPQQRNGCWGAYANVNSVDTWLYRFHVEETFAMGLTFGRILTGRKLHAKEAAFAYRPPPHWRKYKQVFKCPVEFSAPTTHILISSPALDAPVNGSDDELRELCIRQCSLLASHATRRGPVSSRLRMLLTKQGRVTDLNGAAEALHMSARSFRRHLRNEGVTFQQVLDEFRHDLADEYLKSGAMSAKEIAYALGFANVNSFRRAFQSWAARRVPSAPAIADATSRTRA
ncbi:MAG: AraC family transcriptional regulator [Steroidobacteraceae bacterium]